MKQIGVDFCELQKLDEYRYLIVCIDCFSNWSEAKPITDRTAPTIAQFLYEIMCRHGCFAIQINDQGREFVKEVPDELHLLTGVQQRVKGAYREQCISLVQRQNRTIRNSFVYWNKAR